MVRAPVMLWRLKFLLLPLVMILPLRLALSDGRGSTIGTAFCLLLLLLLLPQWPNTAEFREAGGPLQGAPGSVQIGISLEPGAEIIHKEGSKVGVRAKRVFVHKEGRSDLK